MSDEQTNELDLFQQIAKDREEMAKAEEEAKKRKTSGANFSFEPFTYMALEDKKEKVFRIIGQPFIPSTLKRNKPTDPKLFLQSQIVSNDPKKYVKINWPVIVKDGKYFPDPDWILTKLYNEVRKSSWVTYPDGHKNDKNHNGYYVKVHEKTQIFEKIEKNSRLGEKFPKFFYPSKHVAMNVIDRHDEWCKENKSAKVLSSKQTPYTFTDAENKEVTIYYMESGIPYMAYNKIFDYYLKTRGNWINMDTICRKNSDQKDYEIYNSIDRICSEEAKKIANNEPLTAEELEYKLVNLDETFKVTPYYRLKDKLSWIFKMCDAELHTSFYDELEELVKKEALAGEGKKSDGVSQDSLQKEATNGDINLEGISNKPEVVDVQFELPVIENLCKMYFPKWLSLSVEDQNYMINSIKCFHEGVPTYKDEVLKDLYGCGNVACKYPNTTKDTELPEIVKMCPICGAKLGSAVN